LPWFDRQAMFRTNWWCWSSWGDRSPRGLKFQGKSYRISRQIAFSPCSRRLCSLGASDWSSYPVFCLYWVTYVLEFSWFFRHHSFNLNSFTVTFY
jgi:hypothetical protein